MAHEPATPKQRIMERLNEAEYMNNRTLVDLKRVLPDKDFEVLHRYETVAREIAEDIAWLASQ